MAPGKGKRKAAVVDLTTSDDEGLSSGLSRKLSRPDSSNRFAGYSIEQSQEAIPVRLHEPVTYIEIDDETRAAELVEGSQDDDSYASYELYGISGNPLSFFRQSTD
jgi:hypothetical protein